MNVSIPSANGLQEFTIETSPRIFSPGKPDEGTLAMLSQVSLEAGQTLLDLGCGSGLVAIWAAKQLGEDHVSMIDVDPEAVEIARQNAKNNGFGNIKAYCSNGFEKYDISELDWILSNPPYHTDFSVAKHFIEKGFNRLKIGGRLVMVTKREAWYKNKITAIFGSVRMVKINDYFVFTARKKTSDYAASLKKKMKTEQKKHERK